MGLTDELAPVLKKLRLSGVLQSLEVRAALARPLAGSPGAMAIDLITLGVLTAFAAIAMRTERVLRRAEGAALLALYVVFLAALVLAV